MNTVRSAYSRSPWLQRTLVAARPLVCPLEPILGAIPPGKKVLDVGCGVGTLLVSLALRGDLAAGTGCDLNPASIAVARIAASQLKGNRLEFVLANSPAEIPHGPFDVVTLIDVMHHVGVYAQRSFFAACVDRVGPGGLLVYKDMADRPLWKSLANRLHDAVFARQLIHYVPLESIKDWANDHGLVLHNEAAYSQLIAYAHELLVFRRR